jgi:hypothetical protein
MKKDVLIILTGGTIGMKSAGSLGVVPSSEFAEFLRQFPQLENVANVDVLDYLNLPSPHITPAMMLDLAKLIDVRILDYDGVVVTHGTDTLEETAFLCDLVLTTRKPVVFTAAMRSGSDLGLDGPRNIIGAVRVASHHDSVDRGVLVVMNDEIHTARDVVKTDTGKVDSFMSPGYGPLGNVDPDTVFYHRSATLLRCPTASSSAKLIIPAAVLSIGRENVWHALHDQAQALAAQIPEELAFIRPYLNLNASVMRVFARINLRELHHFARLRSDQHAQWEIRRLSDRMAQLVKPLAPLATRHLCGKSQFPSS